MDTDMDLFNQLEELLHEKDDIITDLLGYIESIYRAADICDGENSKDELLGQIQYILDKAERAIRKARGDNG